MTKKKEDELFLQAYEQHRKGQLPEAIKLYDTLLTLAPNHSQALHFLGLAYAQQNEMQKAIAMLNQALKFDPNNTSLHNNLGNAYKNAQQLTEAIAHYHEAIKLKPNYAQAHHNLATVYAAENDYQNALNHYRLAVHAEPDFNAAHFNLGLLLLKHNQLAAAKIQFNNVLTLSPGNPDAEFYLGVLHLEKNQLTKAEQYFQNVLSHDSNQVQAIVNLGVIALKRDKGQIAVDYFTKALVIDNDHVEARNNLAATFIHHDRFENALMHYDVLLQKDPNNSEYLYNSGVAQMALGHLSEAMLHFEKLLSIETQHFAALNNLAAIYIRLEEKEKARELLQRAVVANPNDPASQHMLNALTGDQNKAETCPTYATNLFNNYALYYDKHMQEQLHYNLPQQIARVIHQLDLVAIKRAIDLGCGTGIVGNVLREVCQELTGVDIAPKMLAQAKEKGIYDKLIEASLLPFLKKDKQHYDLALAADVFPYFADLDELFAVLVKRLANNAYFIFSTEISDDQPWQLQATARFCHHPDYIRQLCHQYGLEIKQQERVTARQQENQPLLEILYVTQKVT